MSVFRRIINRKRTRKYPCAEGKILENAEKYGAVPGNGWEPLTDGGYGFSVCGAAEKALAAGQIFPCRENILRFTEVPAAGVKCVICGMEPYASAAEKGPCAGMCQATGRSFEVSSLRGCGWDTKFRQASLRNIAKCVYLTETGIQTDSEGFRKAVADGSFRIAPPGEWFGNLAAQGVLFLNAALTVKPFSPGTGKKYWSGFGKAAAGFLRTASPEAVWFLFGNDAQKEFSGYTDPRFTVTGPHPRMAEFSREPRFAVCPDIDWTGMSRSPADSGKTEKKEGETLWT